MKTHVSFVGRPASAKGLPMVLNGGISIHTTVKVDFAQPKDDVACVIDALKREGFEVLHSVEFKKIS